MIKLNILIFLFFFLFFKLSYATNIAVVNIEELINTNKSYINILNEIDISQKKYHKSFEIKEMKIEEIYNEIENTKFILEENERIQLIDDYNLQLEELNKLVNDFNLHYQNEILFLKNSILKEIIVLLEIYAKDNQIDLIMDSNNYLIASNSINITNLIENKLSQINLNLGYKDFEQN